MTCQEAKKHRAPYESPVLFPRNAAPCGTSPIGIGFKTAFILIAIALVKRDLVQGTGEHKPAFPLSLASWMKYRISWEAIPWRRKSGSTARPNHRLISAFWPVEGFILVHGVQDAGAGR